MSGGGGIDDSAARPAPPEFALDPLQELDGRGLAAIHRLYLRDMSAIAALMGDIRQGLASAQDLAPAVRGMPMAQNLALFGTACGKQCAAITTHHRIEDDLLYPRLERERHSALDAVLARLCAEHLMLHDLIADLEAAADALAADPLPAGFTACATAFAALDHDVRSHFRYEENAIGPALGYYGIRV